MKLPILLSRVLNFTANPARSTAIFAAIIAVFVSTIQDARAQGSTTNTNEFLFDPFFGSFGLTSFSDGGGGLSLNEGRDGGTFTSFAVTGTYTTNSTQAWAQNSGMRTAGTAGYTISQFSFGSDTSQGQVNGGYFSTGTTIGSGTAEALRVGQTFLFRMGGENDSGRDGIQTGGRIGFSLGSGTDIFNGSSAIARATNDSLVRVEFIGGDSSASFTGDTKVTTSMPGFADFKSGQFYAIEILSSDEFILRYGTGDSANTIVYNMQDLAGDGGSIGKITFYNLGANMASIFSNIVVSNSPYLNFSNNASELNTISGVISDNGGTANAAVKNGVGTVIFSGNNSYTGATTISNGTLAVTVDNALGTVAAGTTISSGTTLDFRSVNYSTAESVTNNGGTIATTTGTSAFAGAVTLGANSTYDVSTGATLTQSGAISDADGSFGITKNGAGILILSTANTLDGTSTLSAGTLRLGNNTSLGAGGLAINGGTLASSSSDSRTIANNITLGGNVTLGEAATGTGSLTLSGTFTLGDASGTRTLTLVGNHTISGDVTGTRGIVKQGSGQLTLSGNNNTSTGNIFIDNGTVNLASGSLSASGIDVGSGVIGVQAANNATLKISSASTFNENITVNAETNSSGVSGLRVIDFANPNGTTATLSGTVALEKQTFMTVASGAEGSISGNITGANASVVKQGAGILTLSGANTFATGLFIDSGVLNLSGGSLGTSTIDVGGGVNGNAVNSENATLRVSAALTFSGNFTIHSETNSVGISGSRFIEFANAANTSAGLSGTIAANKTVNVNVVNSTASGALSGVISGNGGLTKTGNGTLTLSGNAANSYSGSTLVSVGTLNLNKSTGNAIVGNVTVEQNAVLLLSASNQVDSGTSDVVTLSGGTIKRASGVSEVFGDLNLTAASFLDFSSGSGGTIEFSGLDYTPSALLSLQLMNFTQGNTLIIRNTSNWASEIGAGFTFSGTGGFGGSTFSDGTFTITAIPEPSTYLAAAGLLAMLLWTVRRRLLKDAKSILGLRAHALE